ncbi:AAA family ATPase [Botrimarina sp.]|uniref:AAA family ATPase n=1 Tax=Botrimarina sp. TaxID=2795802 RepID=UPI0032EE3D66
MVITSGAGCENPKHLDAFIGVGGATVIGDCDRPGQKAAKAWAAALAKNGINARLWHPPYEIQEDGGRDVRDWLAEGHTFAELQREVAENGEAATAADAEPSSSEKPGRPPAQILTFGELAAQHRELRPPVIEGMIREGETANIVSNSKRGKSWLALGLALSVVNNERWLGRYAVRQGRVLLIDNELHPETIAYRVNKVASAMAVPMGNISDDFRIVNLRGDQRSLRELATTFESIEAGEYRLVIIDAKYRLMEPGTDENSNADETQFYNWVDAFASQTRSAFVLIHHASKGDQGGKSIIDIGAGAGAQSRAVDAHVTLRQHEQDDAAVMEAAVRSFPPLAPIALRWAPPLWIVADDQDPGRVRGRKAPRDDKQAADRVEDDALKALTAMRTMPLPESISQIRGAAKIPSLDRAKAAVGHLKAEGYVVDALKIAANGQRYDALDLTAKGRDEGVDEGAGGDAHGGTEQGSDRASETTQEEGLF